MVDVEHKLEHGISHNAVPHRWAVDRWKLRRKECPEKKGMVTLYFFAGTLVDSNI